MNDRTQNHPRPISSANAEACVHLRLFELFLQLRPGLPGVNLVLGLIIINLLLR